MDHEMKNEILTAIGVVGQKIDNMQGQISKIQKEVAKIPEIERQVAKIPEIEKQVAKIPEIERQVAKIPEIEKQVAKIPEIERQVAKIPEIEKQVAKIPKMQEQIEALQKETRNISLCVARIEYDHGEQLRTLFDAITMHTEKMEKQGSRINFCEKKLENHDNEIYYLKSKVQGL